MIFDGKNFVTILEAEKLTGKSQSTIRRLIGAYSDDKDIVREEKNELNRPKYYINKEFLLDYYSIREKVSGESSSPIIVQSPVPEKQNRGLIWVLSAIVCILTLGLITVSLMYFSLDKEIKNIALGQNSKSLKKLIDSPGKKIDYTLPALVKKIKEAVDPSGQFKIVKNVSAAVDVITVYDDATKKVIKYDYNFNRIDPYFISLSLNESLSKDGKKQVKDESVFISDEGTVFKVGKKVFPYSDYIDEEYSKLRTFALYFRQNIFFGIESDVITSSLSDIMYPVNGVECYRIDILLPYPFWGTSKNLSIYIDSNTYLVTQVDAGYLEFTDVKYKEMNGLNVLSEFIIQNAHGQRGLTYVNIENFELNKKINIDKYKISFNAESQGNQKITAVSVLDKVRNALDPKNKFRNSASIKCSMKDTCFIPGKVDKQIDHYYFYLKSNPQVYDYNKTVTNSNLNQRNEITYSVKLYGDNIDDKADVTSSSGKVSPGEANKLKEEALFFKEQIMLGVMKDGFSFSLEKNLVNVDGEDCFVLVKTAEHQFWDGSTVIKYYIDSNTYHINKIQTEFSLITDIQYKKIDEINFPWQYKVTRKKDGMICYVDMISVSLDEK